MALHTSGLIRPPLVMRFAKPMPTSGQHPIDCRGASSSEPKHADCVSLQIALGLSMRGAYIPADAEELDKRLQPLSALHNGEAQKTHHWKGRSVYK